MQASSKSHGTILVLGATGKTGRRVLSRLQQLKLPVRAGTRSGSPSFDWADRAGWSAALQGVDSVYLSYYPDVAVPGAAPDIRAFCTVAVKQGVRHIVMLSGRGEPEAQDCEDIVRQSGIDWTILRASWFSQNFSEAHFLEPVLQGHIGLPVDPVPEPFVDADDIAEVAVAALTDARHIGQLYELTGPQAITFEQAIAILARVTGRPLVFEQVPADAYRDELVNAQMPPDVVDLVMYLFRTVLDGRNTPIADGVQRALGRAPTSFEAYAQKAALTGVWRAA